MATHVATVVVVIALSAGGLLAARMKEKPVHKDNFSFCTTFVPAFQARGTAEDREVLIASYNQSKSFSQDASITLIAAGISSATRAISYMSKLIYRYFIAQIFLVFRISPSYNFE